MLVVVWHVLFLLFPKLHREDFPQGKEEGVHVDVWVFAEAVGLGMVLEVQVVPPTGRGPLQVANHKMMYQVVPRRGAEDGQVSQVMLQPASLGLNCAEQHRTEDEGHEGRPEEPKNEPGSDVQQQDVQQVH